MRRDQGFVAVQAGDALKRRHIGGITQANPGLDLRAVCGDALDQWCEGRIEQHHRVFGVIDDVDQLVRRQTRIAGVHYHAAAGNRVVGFHVPVVVPCDGPDCTARPEAERLQGIG